MFLNLLNPTEKENFIKLAVAVIKADGVIEESEKQILTTYATEMQIPVCNLNEQYDNCKIIMDFATKSTLQIKRIVFIELMALAFADGNYAVEEKNLIQQISDAFNFDQAFVERAIDLEDAYTFAYMSLVNLVDKGE